VVVVVETTLDVVDVVEEQVVEEEVAGEVVEAVGQTIVNRPIDITPRKSGLL
jgi:hypothetical protein